MRRREIEKLLFKAVAEALGVEATPQRSKVAETVIILPNRSPSAHRDPDQASRSAA